MTIAVKNASSNLVGQFTLPFRSRSQGRNGLMIPRKEFLPAVLILMELGLHGAAAVLDRNGLRIGPASRVTGLLLCDIYRHAADIALRVRSTHWPSSIGPDDAIVIKFSEAKRRPIRRRQIPTIEAYEPKEADKFEFLTVEEFAQRVRRNSRTIYNWIDNGVIGAEDGVVTIQERFLIHWATYAEHQIRPYNRPGH
jgi:hypothetical protein